MGGKKFMRYKLRSIVAVALFIFWLASISSFALAKTDEVVSNSADWRDVYSSIIYANLIGASNHFLTSTPHGPILLFEIPKNREGIQIITSADKPFYVGYESLMTSKGYSNVEELIFSQSNLELAKRLPTEIDRFIVLDDAYGYNALAVAPFAAKAKYYVLFANSRNIGEISDFLSTKTLKSIILYGQLDREVKAALARYNPETINSESGSRFENNMKIVDKYSEIGNIKQVILTNGEFIESSMMSGDEAVIFIGKNNVPQEIKDYINSRGVDIGVLIGNELIGSATDIRRQLGISVFVKFARGSRVPGGSINPVEDLDRFPMPSYQLSLSIVSISYNKATGLLEVTYKNNVDLAAYFKSTITVRNANGETIVTDGDAGIIFIDGGETKTITYNRTRGIDPAQLNGELTGEIYTIYGESKTSLENVLRGTFKIEMIEVMDNTDIEIIDLVYDKNRGIFYVTIENTGKVDAYVSAELIDLWINGEYVTVASDEIFKIAVGQKKDIPIKIALAEEDLLDKKNSEIDVLARFGERMHALINSKTKSFSLKFREGTMWYYGVLFVVIILLLLLLIRRRKRCPRCRTMNKKDATICRKCGHQL
ncbi:MAG: hypothetical protein V1866_00785 [archaeon]